jgi:hypothetical protein
MFSHTVDRSPHVEGSVSVVDSSFPRMCRNQESSVRFSNWSHALCIEATYQLHKLEIGFLHVYQLEGC